MGKDRWIVLIVLFQDYIYAKYYTANSAAINTAHIH